MDYKYLFSEALAWVWDNCKTEREYAMAVYHITHDNDFVWNDLETELGLNEDEIRKVFEDADIRLPKGKEIEVHVPYKSWEQQCMDVGINPMEFY